LADDEKQPIIIKKVKKVSGGHHGGAWKVAYADFVTAMMAFFLLLWLLNVTTDEQKALISSYFSPADPRISTNLSGSGGVMGGLTISPDGAMTSNKEPLVSYPGSLSSQNKPETASEGLKDASDQAIEAEMEKREQERFKSAEDQIRQAIESVPELQNLAQNLLIDQTPEGLRIQLVDQEGRSMFEVGSAKPVPEAIKLLKLVSKVVMDLPNMISVRGHTDSRQYGAAAKYTNWELSADRANASRRVMLGSGLDLVRIENVMGKADREHLVKDDPLSARNRRISIILLKEALVPGLTDKNKLKKELMQKQNKKGGSKKTGTAPKKPPKYNETPIIKPKQHEEGIIYFP